MGLFSRRPVWRNKEGKIECPGDSCKKKCNYSCPIYCNTYGLELAAEGSHSSAIYAYECGIGLAPNFDDLYTNAATSYGFLGDHKKAKEYYAKSHELNPNKKFAISGLAISCKHLEEYEECLKWCDLYDYISNDHQLDKTREFVLGELNPEIKVEAEKMLEAMFEEAKNALSNNITEEKFEKSMETIQYLAYEKAYHPSILWMGDFLENIANDYESAAAHYKRAADLGSIDAARNYADMLITGKGVDQNVDLAFKYYGKAAAGGNPEATFIMGERFRNLGNLKIALQFYETAYKLGFEPAKKMIDLLSKTI